MAMLFCTTIMTVAQLFTCNTDEMESHDSKPQREKNNCTCHYTYMGDTVLEMVPTTGKPIERLFVPNILSGGTHQPATTITRETQNTY